MGRHSVTRRRRKSPAVLAVLGTSAAVLFAVGGDVHSVPVKAVAEPPVVEDMCCAELVATAGDLLAVAPAAASTASRWRVIDTRVEQVLPAGDAPEQGLQVKTILVARAISALFPEINSIGGVRPDSLRWHPGGLALDVTIPDPTSASGIALGNEIVAFALKHAGRLGIQDAIWRGVYYTPGGAQAGGHGHYDHVHITTTGGGYPDGDEVYLR
ncbi:hypothetical protein [Mycolicibacterium mengxianglii]|uniref:hypothetical protein n=1 Tax=Mycolicibacterium mengxianglii TaxID=2736649 RepID=UPI0018EED708|nr:hypothetical protein [Mycolicibacterium mengxianglii]